MKKMINATHLAGPVYQHTLELKESGANSKTPGTKYITGKLEVVTDNAGVNVVPVHFTYVTATYGASGKTNDTYNVLMNFINGVYKTVMKDGADAATKVRIDSAIGLNEFYDRNDEFVSVKRNDGGFVHVVANIDEAENERSTFKTDMLITNVRRVEADDEKNTPEKVIIKGAIFNFRKDLLPVEYTVLNPIAMDYFEGLGASNSNPILTEVRGRQISETVTRTVTEESAFGEASVREIKSSRKDFVVTWARRETYEFDSEETITAAELKEAMANRETTLATIKTRNDEYKASKSQPSAAAAPAAGGFNF